MNIKIKIELWFLRIMIILLLAIAWIIYFQNLADFKQPVKDSKTFLVIIN